MLINCPSGGRSHFNRVRRLCTREQVSSRYLHKVYDGAVNELVLNMLSSEKLNAKELLELENIIAQACQKKSPCNIAEK